MQNWLLWMLAGILSLIGGLSLIAVALDRRKQAPVDAGAHVA